MVAFLREVMQSLKYKRKRLLQEKKFNEYFESAVQRFIDQEGCRAKAIPTAWDFWAEIDFVEDYEKVVACMPDSLTGIFE